MTSRGYWENQTIALATLRDFSAEWTVPISALEWLKKVGLIPQDVEWTRRNANPKTNMDANRIPLVYLAECAIEWDLDGLTLPSDFVDAISYETTGARRDNIASILGSLGAPETNE